MQWFSNKKIIKRIGYSFAAIFLLFVLLTSISHLAEPFFNDHRADFEKWADQQLNTTVKIGAIRIAWHHFEPELNFENVLVINPKSNKPQFHIQRIEVDLSIIRSIFTLTPLAENLVISGVKLTIRQLPNQQFRVNGFSDFTLSDNSLTGEAVGGNELLAWIMTQPNLGLKNIDIRFINTNNSEKWFTLRFVTLSNFGSRHIFDGDAMLHQNIPTKAHLTIELKGDVKDLAKISAHVYLYLQGIILPQWLEKHVIDQVQVKQGVGSFKIWADWNDQQWDNIKTTFQSYDLLLYSLVNKKSFSISKLSGIVTAQRKDKKLKFSGEQILLELPEHSWPLTHFNFTLTQKTDNHYALENIETGYVNLKDMTNFILAAPFISEVNRTKLNTLNPSGEVNSFHAEINPEEIQPETSLVTADFKNISVNAYEKIPELHNITGHLSWNHSQGNLNVASTNSLIYLKSVFANPLSFDNASADISWQKGPDGNWLMRASNVRVANPNFAAAADMLFVFPEKDSPNLNLTGTFSLNNAAQVAQYLPLKIFNADLVTWLRTAFRKGSITSGKATVQGKLDDFPFDTKKGKFEISGDFNNLEFEYAPEWPRIQNAQGHLVFAGSNMNVTINSGMLLDLPLKDIRGGIPYIGEKQPQVVNVSGVLTGDLSRAIQFVQTSPLKKTIGKSLAGLQLQGPMQMKLKLVIPIEKPETTRVAADIAMQNANLSMPEWNLSLDNLTGSVQFTENALLAKNMQANFLGEPTTLSIATLQDAAKNSYLRADLQGALSVSALEKWLNLSLQNYAGGAAPYHAELHIYSYTTNKPIEVAIRSNLKGLMLNLPEPYAKKSNETKNSAIDLFIARNQPLQAKLNFENLLSLSVNFQKSSKGFDLLNANMDAKILTLLGQHLNNMHAKITRANNAYRINLDNDKIAGEISYPLNAKETIQAKFQRFYIDISNDNKLDLALNPKTLPAISFVGENVHIADKSLGRVVFDGGPSPEGYDIKVLRVDSDYLQLRANGVWSAVQSHYKTHLTGDAVSANINSLLINLGMPINNLVGSTANAEFDLSWSDAPYHPSLNNMSGNVMLRLGKGHILNVSSDAELGLGRLLNVFSLQTLPRRLSLDFSDLFEKGYAFDSIQGNFNLNNGNATTENTQINGPVARVDINGRIGYEAKNFDLSINVTPYVTSSLPVVAGYLFTPVVGVAAWLVDKMVSRQVSKVTTYHYAVTGTFEHPEWKKVE